MTAPSAMEATIKAYFETLCRRDASACVALFAEDAVGHDPYGAPPTQGRVGFLAFYQGILSLFKQVDIGAEEMYLSGDRAAVTWSVRGTGVNGKTAQAKGINVYTFNEEGKITQLEGYWNPGPLLAAVSG